MMKTQTQILIFFACSDFFGITVTRTNYLEERESDIKESLRKIAGAGN